MFQDGTREHYRSRSMEANLPERYGNGMAHQLRRLPGWSEYSSQELERLTRLICLFAELPAPPDPFGLFPCYAELKERFLASIENPDAEALEEAFLLLYAHVHGYDVPYTSDERSRVAETGGYLSHVGGLSPILKAAPFIGPDTVSGDFGAGNGLQGLLLQVLYPHTRTVQVEISARMAEIGEELREWLGVPRDRVDWIVDDVLNVPATGYDFIYLYRPVRPNGPGRHFYSRFAREVESEPRPPVIFSIADCLRDFLSDRYEVFYVDGHLTCFRPVSP